MDYYEAPSKALVGEYNGIHDNKLFYRAFDLPADAPSLYKCDKSYHGNHSCSKKLCWYFMEINNLIDDGFIKMTEWPCTTVYMRCVLAQYKGLFVGQHENCQPNGLIRFFGRKELKNSKGELEILDCIYEG